MTTDRDVVLRSFEHPQAFGELFDRHAVTIHRVVARQVSAAAADDVVAETFLRAFERRRRFGVERESALPWLFGFAMNVLRHHRRAERWTVQHDLERADEADPVGATGRRIDAQRQLTAVLKALHQMPAGSREVVLLHIDAGLSYEDIAEALRIPVGTVRSRLNRARAKLRALPEVMDRNGEGNGLDGTASYSV